MSSELDILKNIWENKGKSYVKLISNQTGLGLDYVRYICKQLLKKGQIKAERKPNWYRITAKGKKGFERKIKRIKKVVLPWPKKLPKVEIPKKKLIAAQEKKLKLGKIVEKIISSLRVTTLSTKGQKKRGKRGKRKKYAKRRKIKSN